MIRPGCGVGVAHHENILDNTMDSGAGVGDDVVKETQSADMEYSFSSPRRKCRAGTGDDLLRFKKLLRTLLWNICRDFTLLGRIGRAGRPKSSRGR